MKQSSTRSQEAFAQEKTQVQSTGLVWGNASCQLLPVHGEGDLDSIGLFQAVFYRVIWQPVGSKRSTLVEPVELGGHGLEEVRHGRVG